MLKNTNENNELNHINCLIIDDDHFSRTFIKTALYQVGIRNIKEAEDAETSLDTLKKNRIDIILLDQEMPGIKGIDLAKEIKAIPDETINSIPIIMITIDAKENTVKNAKETGINDYLKKPISPLILKNRIISALKLTKE